MKNSRILIAVTMFLIVATPAQSFQSPPLSVSPKGSLVLTGATILSSPSAEPIKNGVVVIQDGVIVAVGRKGSVKIPKGVESLDCNGQTIAAGFWNSHVHFLERKWSGAASIPADDLGSQLKQMLTQYGFTSVFDTWSNFANTELIRKRIESGEVAGPRIRHTGEALMPKRGVPAPFGFNLLGFGPVDIAGIEDIASAKSVVAKQLDAGVDGIKIYAQTFAPRVAMDEEIIQAIVSATHARGKLAFAHPTSSEALLAAVRSGVDVIVHTTPQSPVWDASVLNPMKEKRVALVPTLKLWAYETRHDRFSVQQRLTDTAVLQLRAWAGVGGTTLFGTDVGYMDDYETAEEFALMAKAGMDYRQILASLTTAPAERFGDAHRLGKLAPGYIADLVVLRGDPAKDVGAFANVSYTIRDGRIISRRE